MRFRWDLDSDGAFEREGGTLPTGVSRTFEEPGRFAVRVEVTDVEGRTASVHRMVDVLPPDGDGDGVADPEDDCPDEPATNPDGCPNEAPTAAFEFAPSNPRTGQRVAFDASASRDPDPDDVLHFRWDLDGDGLFENDGGESPTGVGRAFDVGGVYRVGLEVTDRRGRSSLLVREVRVEEPPYVGDSAASEGASNPPSPPRPAPEPAPALITAPPGLPPTPLPTATSSTAKAVAACKRLRSRARRSLCLKRARAAAACRKVQNRRKRTLCLRRARAIR